LVEKGERLGAPRFEKKHGSEIARKRTPRGLTQKGALAEKAPTNSESNFFKDGEGKKRAWPHLAWKTKKRRR